MNLSLLQKSVVFSIGTFIALTVNTLLLQTMAAADNKPNFQWDGNEAIIMTGTGEFFDRYTDETRSQTDTTDDDVKGLPFILESNDGVTARYIVHPGLKEHISLSWQTDVDCTLNNLYLHVDSSRQPNQAVKLSFSNDDITGKKALDPDAIGRDKCNDRFSKIFGGDQTKSGTGVSINLNQPIEGKRGQNTIIYRFNKELGIMLPRERSHFVQRTCGMKPAAGPTANTTQQIDALKRQIKTYKECGKPVQDAYGIIWQQCQYKAQQNIYEQSEPMGMQEDAGNQQVSAFSTCIQQYSGLGINDDALKYLTVIDFVNTGDSESCSVRYIGWIVCPLTRFTAKLTDKAFQALKDLFVITPLDDTSNPRSSGYALYKAWGTMRDIANVLFISLFLMIILSQVTNLGISNYGIKRLLPKLIVTAILVNASYILCVLAVDISNILGSSLYGVFDFLKPEGKGLNNWESVAEKVLVYVAPPTGVGLVLLAGGLIALFPLIMGAVTALFIAVTLIVARYAIILALIVLAPVAIACQLLPNTKQWFDKWKSMFISMLMLYPIVSVVYGASTIAALIVINSGFSRPNGEITLDIFGLAIQLLPFALLPILVRFGGPALGQISNGMRNSGLAKAANGAADKFMKRRKNARDLAALQHSGGNRRRGVAGLRDRVIQRRYRKQALRDMTNQEYHKAQARYVARTAQTDAGFADRLARGGGSVDKVISNAIKAEAHLSAEAIKGHHLSFKEKGTSVNDALDIAESSSTSTEVKQAALQYALENSTPDQFDNIVKRSGNMDAKQRKTVAQASMSRGGYYGSSGVAQSIMNGESHDQESFSKNIVAASINSGNFTAIGIGSSTAGNLQEVETAMDSGHISKEAGQAYSSAAYQAHTNNDLKASGQATLARDDALKRLGQRRWK